MPRSCGSVQNYFRQVDFYPDLRRNQAVLEGMTIASARQGRRDQAQLPAEIPVVVHILYRTDADNLTDEQVASQIDVLNEDYAATNEDVKNVPPIFVDRIGNPGLRFVLATADPSGSPTTGITRRKVTVASFAVNDRMKAEATGGADAWDTTRYLNIWVCRIEGDVLGYAQFPGGPPAPDGVVIFRRVIPVVGVPEGSVVASAKRRPGLPTRSTKIGGTFLMSSLVPAKSSFSTSTWEATCSSERLSVSAR